MMRILLGEVLGAITTMAAGEVSALCKPAAREMRRSTATIGETKSCCGTATDEETVGRDTVGTEIADCVAKRPLGELEMAAVPCLTAESARDGGKTTRVVKESEWPNRVGALLRDRWREEL
jgi:hypothetical protein